MELRWYHGVLAMFGLFGMGLVYVAADWYSTRGLKIVDAECRWDSQQQAYVATVDTENSRGDYAAASVRVQTTVRPGPGQRWAHAHYRRQFESMSDWSQFVVEPHGRSRVGTARRVPGAEGFDCSAKAWISQQERFAERPSEELVNSVMRKPSAF